MTLGVWIEVLRPLLSIAVLTRAVSDGIWVVVSGGAIPVWWLCGCVSRLLIVGRWAYR